jgi:3-oxoacyl-[acyl-carrier protein] reductase
MLTNLEGRWAVVGGASQGIGQATAIMLAECGARVVLLSRRADALEKIRSSLQSPSQHMIMPVDLENLAGLKTTLVNILKTTGPISVLVNNTGGPKAGPLTDASTDEMERAFRGHVLAAQAMTQLLLPGMKEQKFGRIINVLSTSVKIPIPNLGVSNTIRSAMGNWAKTLAAEVGPFGITVNNVLPGFTLTPRFDALAKTTATRDGMSEEQVKEGWLKTIPAARFAEPSELASAITFLASPAASYINGINLPVDGGRTGSL